MSIRGGRVHVSEQAIGDHKYPRLEQNSLAKRHRDIIVISAMAEKRSAIADISSFLALSAINRG